MIVRTLNEIIDSPRDVRGGTWASRRFLLADDGVGFSLSETTIEAGADSVMWYKYHVEANYVIDGEGEVENLATGEVFPLTAGSIYVLDQHERHRLRAFTRMRLVCVFNPPLTGRETHDADGSYAPPAD